MFKWDFKNPITSMPAPLYRVLASSTIGKDLVLKSLSLKILTFTMEQHASKM